MKKHELSNFIPINRRLFQHQLWCEERAFSRFEAWIYLLKEARFEDTRIYDGNKPVDIKRGQIYASVRFLAQAFGWSTSKVVNFIKLLIADDMIVKDIVKETGQMRITVCNYDFYNARKNTTDTPSIQQKYISNTKYKKENTDNKEKNASSKPTWRDSYEVYLKELNESLERLIQDEEFIADREQFKPGVDIRLSLKKAYQDYWKTPEAWERRRKQSSRKLDWKATFKNALDISSNQVKKKQGRSTSSRTALAGDKQKLFAGDFKKVM